MRTVYHEKLSELADQLGRLCGLAGAAMERATRALLQADLASAEQVISDHDQIKALGTRAEESAVTLLALQQPVAGELRSIVSWVQVTVADARIGWAHWPCMWPRSPEGDIQITCCPRKSRAVSPKWAALRSNWRTVRRTCC